MCRVSIFTLLVSVIIVKMLNWTPYLPSNVNLPSTATNEMLRLRSNPPTLADVCVCVVYTIVFVTLPVQVIVVRMVKTLPGVKL